MVTTSALLRTRNKQLIAAMTGPSHALHHRLPHQILAASARRDSQDVLVAITIVNLLRPRRVPKLVLVLERRFTSNNTLALLRHEFPERGLRVLLSPRGRVARAALAPGVLAVDADSVGSERRLAAVAAPAHAHADGFRDALDRSVGGLQIVIV